MSNQPQTPTRTPAWVGPVVFILIVMVVALGTMMGFSVMERRWEAQRPSLVYRPIGQWETDPAVWGRNYPLEYESWKLTEQSQSKTKYGGSFPRDYLEADPYQVILFAGYPFSKDYKQARGHFHAVEDASQTKRVNETNYATCWTCKSPDVPRLMHEMGVKEFYHSNFLAMKDQVKHPISCLDCHDPQTMQLRVSRPALREAFAAMGRDIDQASHQEMRSLVCAQCHVEYYFQDKYYLAFPWKKGLGGDPAFAYYNETNFSDWTHGISKTPTVKAQHPDYEMYTQGIHARSGVACADCHMPYKTSGGLKFTDHHVESPLLNIANSCAVCHRRSEAESVKLVESIQDQVHDLKLKTEKAVVYAHFDVAAAMQAGCGDTELTAARAMLRHAQFNWDYVSANNGMGFHAPQESMRLLGEAIDQAQESRLAVAKLLAAKGISGNVVYPDISTREKAYAVAQSFVSGTPPKLLP